MNESDLYPPLKAYLENQGYEVKGEVVDCDVMAIRENEPPLIVELKLHLNLDLLMQGVDRFKFTDNVYLGVPGTCKALKKQRKRVIKLLRMLGLGLIAITPGIKSSSVEVLIDPGPYTPRQSRYRRERLLKEFSQRVGDPMDGGSTTKSVRMTAYRQQAIVIATYLKNNGPSKASKVAAATDNPKARGILYRNVYGWFDNLERGIYYLSPKGVATFQESD